MDQPRPILCHLLLLLGHVKKNMTIATRIPPPDEGAQSASSRHFRLVFKAILTCAVLTVWDVVTGLYFGGAFRPASQAMIFAVVANAIVSGTAAFLAARTPWRGVQLVLALVTVPFAVATVNAIEGLIYLDINASKWMVILSIVKYTIIVPIWLMAASRIEKAPPARHTIHSGRVSAMIWRFGLCDFLYLFIYFVAGMIVLPSVRDFYATQTMPPLGTIAALQLLLRGPVFMFVCVLLSVMIGGGLIKNLLTVGAVFTLVSGIAPLIVPNPFFPDSIRWIHFWEVTVANFLYGVLVAAIWWPGAGRSP